MLKTLHIKNYVLIDSLDIEFPAGLVIITGQTGAGKSIILGALSLVLGGKADASVIGNSGDNCVVEAEFTVEDDGTIKSFLDENGIDFDENVLIIRRVLNANGRSRSFVNDCPASVKVLSALSSRLVDIHSQHETMLLRDKKFQMSMLDHYAGNKELLSQCADSWHKVTSLKNELTSVTARIKELKAEQEYNQAQFEQLDSAKIIPGELPELEAEQKRLANAEEIKSALYQVENMFSSESADGMSVDSVLKDSVKILSKIASYVPSASALSERVESARLELDDILSEVSELESSTDVSNERLSEVEDRLSLLYGLLKKYSCQTLEELSEIRDKFESALSDTLSLDEKKQQLSEQLDAAEKELDDCCQALHNARANVLKSFSESICTSIRSLELERSVFEVELTPVENGPSGADEIQFLFSSTGKSPVDVAKCASGGEMSRIMLCLKAMMAKFTNMPAMIFDEIDTGVSGSVADKMGAMICSMGEYMQVFAITHLPQVAAKGNAHYIVSKSFEGERAITTIRKISGKDRVLELARLLSGAEVTPEAVANAERLLNA